MDSSIIAIAVVGSVIFFGVLAWKAVWFIRKINEAPADDGDKDRGDR